MKRTLKQTTLDGMPFVDRDRLGRPVRCLPKPTQEDYVLMIAGSRSIKDAPWVFSQLNAFVEKEKRGRLPVSVIHGGSVGVDTLGEYWAQEKQIPIHRFDAMQEYLKKWPVKEFHWLGYEKRDQDLVDLSDTVIVLWDGKSSGSSKVAAYAESQGKLPVPALVYGNTRK